MIEYVLKIAAEAAAVVKEGYRKTHNVEFKTNHTNLVTEIDKRSEKTIIEFIKKNFPGHGIIAEESGNENQRAEYVWVIDPLDGTTNFAHGLPVFSVSIGVQKNGETICGVVHDVMMDRAYGAELGAGAFVIEQGSGRRRLQVSTNDDLRYSLLVTGFPYDVQENPGKAVDYFGAFLKNSRAVRRLGSAAIDLCYVADGVFDGFWEVSLNPWDICAGKLLVEEAGGSVTDFNGIRQDIFCKQLLATNGKVHKSMMEILV